MKSIMRSNFRSLFKNMVNYKETLNLIIMRKMRRRGGKILIVRSLEMIMILLKRIFGKVIWIRPIKKGTGSPKIQILRLINRLMMIMRNSIDPNIKIKIVIMNQRNMEQKIKNKL